MKIEITADSKTQKEIILELLKPVLQDAKIREGIEKTTVEKDYSRFYGNVR